MEREILHAELLLLELGLGLRANLDDGNAAGEARGALLELLLLVVSLGSFGEAVNLPREPQPRGLVGAAITDDSAALAELDARGVAEHLGANLVEGETELILHHGGAGEDGDILEVRDLRSPKPGALSAQILSAPRSLFTTRVASASCSMSSAMMREGEALLDRLLEDHDHVAGRLHLLVDEKELRLS